MTNIVKKSKQSDMHLHISNARQIIDEYLPNKYTEEVISKLPKGFKLGKYSLYNVAQKKSNNLDILNAMVEVALENKEKIEKFKALTALS